MEKTNKHTLSHKVSEKYVLYMSDECVWQTLISQETGSSGLPVSWEISRWEKWNFLSFILWLFFLAQMCLITTKIRPFVKQTVANSANH